MKSGEMKYVILENLFPVIFCKAIPHKAMISVGMKITSAGFLTLSLIGGKWCADCYGKSEGLGMRTSEMDAPLVELSLNKEDFIRTV